MFPHKVTLFNKLTTKTDDVYIRTLLNKVLYIRENGTSQGDFDTNPVDIIKVYIPKQIVQTEGKSYINSKELQVNFEEGNTNLYTFSRGDYIGLGEINLEDLTPTEYRNRYGNIFEITSISDYNMGNLQSWMLIAK